MASIEAVPLLLAVYAVASVSFRLAFCPDWSLSWAQYSGFIILDLVATIFFSYEAINIAKQTAALVSPRSILPTTESPKDESAGQSVQSHDESADDVRPPRTIWACWRVFFHFASTLPLEYLSFFLSGLPANYLLLNRLLRIFFLPKYLQNLLAALARKGRLRNVGLQRTWVLFFAMALAGHLCGCGFFLVARIQAQNGVELTWPEVAGLFSVASTYTDDGLEQIAVRRESSAVEAWISSLYWAFVTMITTGFGDIVPLHVAETAWCILSMFVGVLIAALTIANLQRTIGQFDAARLGFQRKVELVKKFMRYRCLPKDIQERVLSFYDHQWSVLKGADEEQFLLELPRTLQQQVTNYLCRDVVASLPLLRGANKALLNALVEISEMNVYSPGDDLVRRGEKIRGCLLVAQGEVEVRRGSVVERKMKRLDRFAQDCLFVDRASTFTVTSKGFSEVILIPRDEFQQTINSVCDKDYVAQLKETAANLAKTTTKANKMFGSGEDLTPTKGLKRHLHPTSFFRTVWDFLVLLGLVFYVFSIPLSFMHLVENTPFGETPLLLSLGYVVDAFFWIDAVLEFNFFFYVEVSGLVVFDRDHIRRHFKKRHNVAREVVGLVPFDLAGAFFGGKFCHFFRLAKLVRLPNIAAHAESVDVLLNALKVDVDLSLYRVVKLNVVMITVCHWVGCLFYMMASLSTLLGHEQNWRLADESNPMFYVSHLDFGGFAAYLRSIYWAIVGMSTVGYGDIVPTNIIETTFATFVILFGGLVLPAVVGGLAAYISGLRMTAKLFRKQVSKVRLYLRRVEVQGAVLDKVSRYYDYHWTHQGGVLEQEVMDELPPSLQDSVSSYVNGATIHSLPFLCRCDEATKQVIAAILQPRVFTPGDVIVQEGEKGFEMYFLKRGQVVVTSSALTATLRVLSGGDFFGESCLLGSTLSGASVTASTYCECFSLNREEFREVIASSPFAAHVRTDLANLVMQAKHRNARALKNLTNRPKCHRLVMGAEEGSNAAPANSPVVKSSVILPDSSWLLAWNTFLFLICVYNAWIVPFRLAFDTSNQSIIVDWVLDACFLLDMVLNCRFLAFTQGGELVTDPRKIKSNYVASRLRMDLLSSLPFDLVAYYLFPQVRIVSELLRVLKMLRFARHFGALEKLFQLLETRHVPLAGFRLVEFLSGVILIAHWAACGFFFIARLKSSEADCSGILEGSALAECLWSGTWIYKQIYDGKLPVDGGVSWQHYLRSFNWALPTLVVVVIGDVVPTTSPETLYAFLLMALGVTVNAAIVGNVANIVANLENDSSDFARKVDEIRNYLAVHRLQYDLHARVDDFTRYLWTAHSGSTNEDEFILRLPYTLQTEVIASSRTRLLLSCPFFDFFTHDVVKAIALCLRPSQFCAGDIIVHAGDFGQSMFFLESGEVKVVAPGGGAVLATLTAGSFFGETSLFLKQPRASSVCAVSFCDVFECSKADVFAELRRREIDIGRTIKLFASIHKQNIARQRTIQQNLTASKRQGTKLSKMIDEGDDLAQEKKPVPGIFMPSSLFRFCLDLVGMALIVYFLAFVPYNVAFSDEGRENQVMLVNVLADVFFMIDFRLRSTHFAFTRNGSVHTDRAPIWEQYRANGMVVDALSCLSVLEVAYPELHLRLFSLLRILRIPAFIQSICEHLSLRGMRISLATNLLGRVVFFYAVANHWVACVWFIIHRYIDRTNRFTWGTADCPWGADVGSEGCLAVWNEELGMHNVCNLDSMRDCYLRSLHFALTTLSTVGYGDISPVSELETIWEQCVVLLGACFLAGMIGAFGAYLSEVDTLGVNAYKEKIQQLKKYMHYRDLPDDIQASILFFHQRRWKDSQTLDERETLRILPGPLQLDISFAVKQKVIRLVPILDALPTIVQQRIAHALILQVYSVRDHPIVYAQGDIGWEIYFIASGVVAITLPTDLTELDSTGRSNASSNKEKFDAIGRTLGPGNHVGESCLCSESGVRQETVMARTLKVEAYVLSREDLDGICRLLGVEKGSALRHALLCRNKASWHTFTDADSVVAEWEEEDETSVSGERRKKQASHNAIPWATPKPGSELTGAGQNTRTTMRSRRRTSVQHRLSMGSLPHAEIQNLVRRLQQEGRIDDDSSSVV
ncbi:hypothetical protein ACHAXT_000694 [Thalassiosira profunda]